MRLVILALAMGLASTSPAMADDCAKVDQAALKECMEAAFKKAEEELKILYRQIEQRLKDDAGRKEQFVTAQRAWLFFRDLECEFSASGVAGGTIYPMVFSSCALQLTHQRSKDFKTYLNCKEGDTSCPVPPK